MLLCEPTAQHNVNDVHETPVRGVLAGPAASAHAVPFHFSISVLPFASPTAKHAVALGHAIGQSGSRLLTTILHEMKRRDVRYGMVTMCVGGGQGAAGIFELM